MENIIKFGTLQKDGSLTNVRTMKQSNIGKCPFYILAIDHYRDDGSCKCSNAGHRQMMLREWGYTKNDFANIPLID